MKPTQPSPKTNFHPPLMPDRNRPCSSFVVTRVSEPTAIVPTTQSTPYRTLLLPAVLLLLLLFSYTVCAKEPKILVIESARLIPYEKALKHFRKTVGVEEMLRKLCEKMNEDEVIAFVEHNKPDLVLTVGTEALKKVRRVRAYPVVYMMALNPDNILTGQPNITGVSMNFPQEIQMDYLIKALPRLKRIGILYHPHETQNLVDRIRTAAGRFGVDLIATPVTDIRLRYYHLEKMKGRADVYWMLPDLFVYKDDFFRYLLAFSIEKKLPVFSYAAPYTQMGAFISLGFEPTNIGDKVGRMALDILSGKPPEQIPAAEPTQPKLSINRAILLDFNIPENKELMDEAEIYH